MQSIQQPYWTVLIILSISRGALYNSQPLLNPQGLGSRVKMHANSTTYLFYTTENKEQIISQDPQFKEKETVQETFNLNESISELKKVGAFKLPSLDFLEVPEKKVKNAKEEDNDDINQRVEDDKGGSSAGPDANVAAERPRSEQGSSPAGSAQQAQSPTKRRRPISP